MATTVKELIEMLSEYDPDLVVCVRDSCGDISGDTCIDIVDFLPEPSPLGYNYSYGVIVKSAFDL